ncbi:MAG TPA: GNAT family N-acetyltransferase [Thermoanaerobaculia bacterium]|nr:GNAT family N-acetyltransferase [Thermoanaerobaculia bacterium]
MGDAHRALEQNFVTHASWIPARIASARVHDEPSYLLVDSGLATDTFNLVCRALLDAGSARDQIARAAGHFVEVGRSFSWWVGPLDEPADLGAHLTAAGLVAAESEAAMALRIEDLAPRAAPEELRVLRVQTPAQLGDFARVVAANWDPPDSDVLRFYDGAVSVLDPAAPIRLYIGYVEDKAVATSELCLGGGVAGLYGVATLREHRRKGYGDALTRAPLLDAQREGCRLAVLQASDDGIKVYRRMGFRVVGSYTEYKARRDEVG